MKGRLAAGFAGAALVLAIPSAGLAVSLLDDGEGLPSIESFASFTPASADPRMAELIQARQGAKAGIMRFTPAGAGSKTNRSLTVAVRVDDETAQAISVRNAIQTARENVAAEATPRIAPTRYNLGIARGYQSFAQTPAISQSLSDAEIPDLAQFEPSQGIRQEPSRFAARIELEDGLAPERVAPHTLDSTGNQSLDVVGSYRLTRNLDVTAGLRYQQERDRLTNLPDIEQQDSQAVYIGTQFRF